MPETEKYTAARSGPGTIRDPLGAAQSDDDASDELGDESGSDEHPVGDDEQAASPACSGEHSAQTISDQQLNQFETPLGLDSAASPDFVQHVAAFKAQLDLVHDAVKKVRSAQKPSTDNAAQLVHDDAASAANTAQAAAEEECFRAVVDLREAAMKLDKH